MELTELLINAVSFILPIYGANALPVLTGGGRPLDFGKKFFDGRQILGNHKTFRGFFSGLIIGSLIGFAETLVVGYPFFLGVVSSLGALLGDLAGAFAKRRLGIAPGGLLPIVDQVDFVVGAVLLSLPFSEGVLSWLVVLIVVIVTPPVHLLTNYVAYKAHLKDNPW